MPLTPRGNHATIEPSTRAIFLRGGKKLLGFTIGWLIIEAVWWHGRYGISWPLEVGGLLAIIDMAILYRRPEWRRAVAPEHMLGIGFCFVAYIGATFWLLPDDTARSGWLRIGAVILLAAAPIYLMLLAIGEMLAARGMRS